MQPAAGPQPAATPRRATPEAAAGTPGAPAQRLPRRAPASPPNGARTAFAFWVGRHVSAQLAPRLLRASRRAGCWRAPHARRNRCGGVSRAAATLACRRAAPPAAPAAAHAAQRAAAAEPLESARGVCAEPGPRTRRQGARRRRAAAVTRARPAARRPRCVARACGAAGVAHGAHRVRHSCAGRPCGAHARPACAGPTWKRRRPRCTR